MHKKSFFAVLLLLMVSLLIVPLFPVSAWNYTDEVTPDDENFEKFGPRADKLLIKLYEDAEGEWDALDRGELDMTDWPLTKPYYNKFTTPPEDAYVDTMWSGPEFGIRLLDINNNPEEYMGNPPNPAYPNPVYPNPCSCENMRRAIWYLHNKPVWLPTIIGPGFYADIDTVVPPVYGAFHKPLGNPYPYNPATAIAELESDVCPADGAPDFPWDDKNGNTVRDPGEVFWDLNGNGVNDGGDEELCLIFVIRSDDIHRLSIANQLIAELGAVGICVDSRYGPVALAYTLWFYGKAAHLYTGGWGLGVDPDHIILWNYYFYWHPGFCYNTGAVHDPILDATSWAVMTANTEEEALTNCWAFQDRFAEIAAAVPWWSYSSTYAVYRTYSGPEAPYTGNYWDGIVNVPGMEPDGFFSFLNMHPRGYPSGDGNMIIRHAFKTAELKSFNPVYAEWVWEWHVLGEIYEDGLLARNPYNLPNIMPWMASDYNVGNYNHPVYGTCTKVKFTLRPDLFWADGKQITVADIQFTFVELDDILRARGLPPPWWYDSVAPILSFSILDAYNFEVLLDTKSIYNLKRGAGNIILPKQIWKPLAEDGPIDSMTADPNMIGSGPWRFQEYVAFSHVLLVANKPDTTVTTNHPGAVPVTSTMGYHRCQPFSQETYIDAPPEYVKRYKLPEDIDANLTVNVYNQQINDDMTGDWNATLLFNEELVGMELGEIYIPPAEPCRPKYVDLEVRITTWACGMVRSWGYWHRLTDNDPGVPDLYKIHKEFWGWAKAGAIIRIYFSYYAPILERHVKVLIFTFTVTVSGSWRVIFQFHVLSRIKIGTLCKKYPFSRCTRFWFTIKEDIAGSTFYDDIDEPCIYKAQLPTPDFKVDIKDVALAAKAFGAYPGHERWSTVADLNSDYQIDIRDVAAVARMFGWVCMP